MELLFGHVDSSCSHCLVWVVDVCLFHTSCIHDRMFADLCVERSSHKPCRENLCVCRAVVMHAEDVVLCYWHVT